jgi:uncharacterized Zn-binding protein involved in type VI secretion
MSGNTVRVGDSVSCGDHSASGSGNTFANGLPITNQGQKTTTGHGCFPPTVFVGGWSSTVFVNNQPIALKGVTKIKPHRCGKKVHDGVAITASPDVYIET